MRERREIEKDFRREFNNQADYFINQGLLLEVLLDIRGKNPQN